MKKEGRKEEFGRDQTKREESKTYKERKKWQDKAQPTGNKVKILKR